MSICTTIVLDYALKYTTHMQTRLISRDGGVWLQYTLFSKEPTVPEFREIVLTQQGKETMMHRFRYTDPETIILDSGDGNSTTTMKAVFQHLQPIKVLQDLGFNPPKKIEIKVHYPLGDPGTLVLKDNDQFRFVWISTQYKPDFRVFYITDMPTITSFFVDWANRLQPTDIVCLVYDGPGAQAVAKAIKTCNHGGVSTFWFTINDNAPQYITGKIQELCGN